MKRKGNIIGYENISSSNGKLMHFRAFVLFLTKTKKLRLLQKSLVFCHGVLSRDKHGTYSAMDLSTAGWERGLFPERDQGMTPCSLR